MKKIHRCFVILFILHLSTTSLFAQEQLLSIVVIGGGVAGLATAIEAKMSGAHVTIVEKRESYSRVQWIVLHGLSLNLLEKWKLTSPKLQDKKEVLRFIRIKDLEEALFAKVREQGITICRGEFQGFKQDKKIALIRTHNTHIELPYDIIVGADGEHSTVRTALGIQSISIGSAKGIAAFLPISSSPNKKIEEIRVPLKRGIFIRKLEGPSELIIFLQINNNHYKVASNTLFDTLLETTKDMGWDQEYEKLLRRQAAIYDNIPVVLRQVDTYSHKDKAALLVGDAAATASFYYGHGANTALAAAEIAGHFFAQMKANGPQAFDEFNKKMKESTDAMMQASLPLFRDTN